MQEKLAKARGKSNRQRLRTSQEDGRWSGVKGKGLGEKRGVPALETGATGGVAGNGRRGNRITFIITITGNN